MKRLKSIALTCLMITLITSGYSVKAAADLNDFSAGRVLADASIAVDARLYNLHLPAQSVAEALTLLSEQTDLLVLFPYEIAASRTANAVVGRYRLQQALNLMLAGTGLSGGLTQDDVITISLRPNERVGDNMNSKKQMFAALTALFVGSGGSVSALGQEVEASGGNRGLDEIIVTAQKREQSLDDIALAVSALSGDDLASRGINSGYDLQFSLPAITIGESNVGPAQISIRGVGMENIFLGGDPGVPVHIDGHYIQDTSYILQDFLDIERVEVLRGPQGTLYGRNAMGGSVNVITKKPTEDFYGQFSVDMGNYDKRAFQAVISGSLTDRLRGRVVVSDHKRDGYLENISTLGGQNLKNADYTNIRTIFEYDLNDDLVLTFSGYYLDDAGNTLVPQTISPVPTSVLAGFVNYYALNNATPNPTINDPRKVNFDSHRDHAVSRAKGASLDLDWNFEKVIFKSLSSYNHSNDSIPNDVDGTSEVLFNDDSKRLYETFSQEFQLISGDNSISSWIVGAFYYRESSESSEVFDLENLFTLGDPKSILEVGADLKSEAIGFFGQIEYPLTDQLIAVGGIRYNQDEKEFVDRILIPDFGLDDGSGNALFTYLDDEWEEVTGKVGLNYNLNDEALMYFSYSSGYKAGGFNGANPAYNPETVEAFEVGYKGSWFDRVMVGSASAFYYDYSDKQEFKRDSLGFAFITNAGAASLWGVELEGKLKPIEALTLDLSISYLNTEYDDFDTADNINPGLGVLDLSGNALPRSPEYKIHLGIEYGWNLDMGHISARADAVWVDEQYSSAFNRPERDLIDSYNRINAQLNWRSLDDHWLASLYINNIQDDDTIANLFDNSSLVGLPVPIYAHYFSPRTYGLKVTYQL